jgi:hypothetical protein
MDAELESLERAAEPVMAIVIKHWTSRFSALGDGGETRRAVMLAIAEARMEALEHRHHDGLPRLRCTDRWCEKLAAAEALGEEVKR